MMLTASSHALPETREMQRPIGWTQCSMAHSLVDEQNMERGAASTAYRCTTNTTRQYTPSLNL